MKKVLGLLRYLYRLSEIVVTTSGACLLMVLIVSGLSRLTEPTFRARPDFTATTTTGWTYFWITTLVIYLVGSAGQIVYHFIKNDNKETK